jgi:threonine dehydrogenase-like Zn-dependent dehydrogenase
LASSTLELLAAAGAVPLGMDTDSGRVQLARSTGFFATTDAGELEAEAVRRTADRGADAVLVTVAASNAASLAAAIAVARERATVCVVGDVKIELPRPPLFTKELRLIVSRSYGPGTTPPTSATESTTRGAIRWTEGRNLEEVFARCRVVRCGRRVLRRTYSTEAGP